MLMETFGGGSLITLDSIPHHDKASLTGALFCGVAKFLMRHSLVPQPARVVLPLYVMYTHIHEDYFWASYLNITSPEPGSGKTTAGEILSSLSCRGTRPLYGTAAAIRDFVSANHPTLVLDEWDSMPSEMRRLFTAILNTGTRKDGCYLYKSGGAVVKMSTFCPKIIIGRATVSLPDVTLSRCIPATLHKAKPGQVEQYGESEREEAQHLQESLVEWADDFRERQVKVEPKVIPQ